MSLVVHTLLYAGFNTRDQFPFVWRFLQYAIVIGFIPKAVSYLSTRLGIIKTIRRPPYVWGSAKYEEQSLLEVYGGIIVGVAVAVLFLYAIFNPIYWGVELLHQGEPYVLNGKYFVYYFKSHRTLSLTAEEYKLLSLYYARATSSHWMVCHLIALVLLHGSWNTAPNKSVELTKQ